MNKGDMVKHRETNATGHITDKGIYTKDYPTGTLEFVDIKWDDNTKHKDGGYSLQLLKTLENE